MPQFVDVLLPLAVKTFFTYLANENLSPPLQAGQFVQVSFRRREQWGIVWQSNSSPSYQGNMKSVGEVSSLPPFSASFLTFLKRVADYNYFPLGLSLKLALNPVFLIDKKARKPLEMCPPLLEYHTPVFSGEQRQAIDSIATCLHQNTFHPLVIDGVTGSGKTEVYLEAVYHALQQGKQALVLLPEIALTNQLFDRFKRRFGVAPLVWHSNISPQVKKQTWQAVLKGEAKVIIGARSALFLPFQKLGLVVVDEEHDGSYKQEEQITYHGRDMAVLRASIDQATILLVSATPSLETVQNITSGRYQKLTLTSRHGGAALPSIYPIDMRQQPKGWLSPPLRQAIQTTLDGQQQVMLYLNRRGYAPLTLCRQCGHRLMCPRCAVALVEHKERHRLCCHHCGYNISPLKECPECNTEDSFIPCGPGVERIYEQVCRFFPTARIMTLTSDSFTSPVLLEEMIQKIQTHQVDILIGTQILAKGHHFPLITLVGVIDADLGLSGGDLRGGERTYQLLHQVSGRAGREKNVGKVLLQTYSPTHPVMQSLCQQERDTFNALELEERQHHFMPPFSRLITLYLAGKNPTLVAETARQVGLKAPSIKDVHIYGPSPAPISYLRGKHRWRFLIKLDKSYPFQRLLDLWLARLKIPASVSLQVDVDPQNFY